MVGRFGVSASDPKRTLNDCNTIVSNQLFVQNQDEKKIL